MPRKKAITDQRAFVFEPLNTLDLAAVGEFGPTTYLFNHGDRRKSVWQDEFAHEVIYALEEEQFNPKEDYFVISGRLMVLVRSVAAIVSYYGCIRALFYDVSTQKYRMLLVGVDNLNSTSKVQHD